MSKRRKSIEELGSAAIRGRLRCLPGTKLTQLAKVSQAGGNRQADGLVRRHGTADVDLALGTKALGDG